MTFLQKIGLGFTGVPAISLLFFCASCHNGNEGPYLDPANSGSITFYADTTYCALLHELIKSYENVYTNAHVHVLCTTEEQAMQAMYIDSTRMCVIGRKLEPAETQKITAVNEIAPKQYIIAHNAIAVIAGRNFPSDVFDFDAFVQSRRAGYSGPYSDYDFVFDRSKSDLLFKLTASRIGEGFSTEHMYQMDTREKIADYVNRNPKAIGFIDFSEVSDIDEPGVKEYLGSIRVLNVRYTDSTGTVQTDTLSQGNIYSGKYLLQTPINVVQGSMREQLGTGFVNFLYQSKASRIFLKAGLIPDIMPERQLIINQ